MKHVEYLSIFATSLEEALSKAREDIDRRNPNARGVVIKFNAIHYDFTLEQDHYEFEYTLEY